MEGRRGVRTSIEHHLHDLMIELRVDSESLADAAARYLRYLDGPWDRPVRAVLSFGVASACVAEAEDRLGPAPAGESRPAEGWRIVRAGDALWAELPGMAVVRADLEAGSAEAVIDPGREHPYIVRDLLGLVLGEMLRSRGRYPLHAALCEFCGRGVAIVGPTGAGKSTLALGLTRGGFGLLTDDWALLDETPAGVVLSPLTRSLSVPEDQASDALRSAAFEVRDEAPWRKYVLDRDDIGGSGLASVAPALVILLERVESEVSELVPATQTECLARALGQSALATADAAAAAAQARVVRRLVDEAHWLCLRAGRDMGRDPAEGARMLRRRLS